MYCVIEGHVVVNMASSVMQEPVREGLFVSNFSHSLDPKRRLTIPAEWRALVGEPASLYVLPDIHETCLCAYPAREMVHRLGKMRSHSIADRKARSFARALASQSDVVPWDGQGRIRIKDELLALAGIQDKVVLVGAFDCFELWNPEALQKAGGMDKATLKAAAEYVGF